MEGKLRMGSLTAIVNPLDPTDALLFYTLGTQNLALEHRPLGGGKYTTTYKDNNITTGSIAIPGDLGVVQHNNTVTLYGIQGLLGGDGKYYNVVSYLSPTVNPVDEITNTKNAPLLGSPVCANYSSLAATGDVSTNDYVYFLQDRDNAPGMPRVIEYSFTTEDPSYYPFDQTLPKTTSRLAAVFEPGTTNRFIFYQGKDLYLYVLSSNTGSGVRVEGTGDAIDGCPLAVATVENEDHTIAIYLYYVSTSNYISRMSCSNSSNPRWIKKSQVGSLQIAQGSGLSVVTDGVTNYMFFGQTGAGAYTVKKDPIASQEPLKLHSHSHEK